MITQMQYEVYPHLIIPYSPQVHAECGTLRDSLMSSSSIAKLRDDGEVPLSLNAVTLISRTSHSEMEKLKSCGAMH